jgi:hypothetical protein
MDKDNRNAHQNRPIHYEIRIKSYIDCDWSEWFEGLTITQEEDGTTLLAGPIPDQAALYGLLKRINDLGLPLVSFNQLKTN